MIAPAVPINEKKRQAAVERYNILDTLPEENYDNITALIARLADAPVSLITMLDHQRNYLKSHYGVPFDESPREVSFCGHAINSEETVTIVEDATKDDRFHDNPLVTDGGVRFYAGVPLITPDSYKLGTLCIFDTKPRSLEKDVKEVLINMAKQVETILEHRYQNQLLIDYQKQLEARNKELKYFAQVVAHDIKAPIVSNLYLAKELSDDWHALEIPENAKDSIEKIVTSSTRACKYIDEMLGYYTSDSLLSDGCEAVDLPTMLDEVREMTASVNSGELTVCELPGGRSIEVNRGAVLQVLVNLVTNAFKFCNKDHPIVEIDFQDEDRFYQFSVTDNGVGIPADKIADCFRIFSKP